MNRGYYKRTAHWSAGGNPLTKYVNLEQSPEERRDKYQSMRLAQIPVPLAYQARDWHWPKIALMVKAYLGEFGFRFSG